MGQPLLKDILARYDAMNPAQQAEFQKATMAATSDLRWVPNPGPQTEAYNSQADVLLFGGEPGGGKSQLGLGLAFNCHQRSLIVRRQYTDLSFLIDSAIKINGSREGYSGKPPPRLTVGDRLIQFGAAAHAGDEQRGQGQPYDLMVFDEGAQFLESQVRFWMGWNRSDSKGQRCRVVIPSNPPLTSEGAWLVKMFAPWFDEKHPHRAEPGELCWVVIDQDDEEHWVEGPGKYELSNGDFRYAQSRTYIPSGLSDNPSYNEEEYRKKLDQLPAEIREILLGGFKTTFRDHPQQVIPTAWIRAAFERHKQGQPSGIPMTAMGVDPTGGGDDPLAIATRYDWWYAPLVIHQGYEFDKMQLGRQQAGKIVTNRKDNCKIAVDLGGGYGGGILECLIDNVDPGTIVAHKGAEGSSARTKDNKMGFFNKRAEVLWKFREALDPEQEGGSPVALQEDIELLADLTAVTYEVTPRGYKVTPKDAPGKDTDSVRRRLGRSPNKGDAVVMAWSVGPKLIPKGDRYPNERRGRRTPGVNLGHRHRPIRR